MSVPQDIPPYITAGTPRTNKIFWAAQRFSAPCRSRYRFHDLPDVVLSPRIYLAGDSTPP